jgi:putative membrane protein insertion efficiency factor
VSEQTQGRRGVANLPARVTLLVLGFYKAAISPWLPRACRYEPTCSVYAREAIERHGFRRGSWLTIRRLSRCHPFRPGGLDPVP